MNEDGRVATLRPEVSVGEVVRYLGYPGEEACSDGVRMRLAELWPRACSLLRPRGTYRVVDHAVAAGVGMPEAGERVALALSTIGEELEAESDAASRAGALLDALVLDAFGSAAAEAAADVLNLMVCKQARSLSLAAAPRISPGYGEWDVAWQGGLLAMLPSTAVGVTLTSGGMMVPRKSVSFAASFVPASQVRRSVGSACERCGMKHCRHRATAERPSASGV